MSGFPWNLISFSFSEFLPLLQILSLIGTYSLIYFVSLFIFAFFFFLKKNKHEIFCSLFGLLLIWSFIWPIKPSKIKNTTFKDNNFLIKIISPKIGIERFYYTENEEEILENLIKLSKPNKELKRYLFGQKAYLIIQN